MNTSDNQLIPAKPAAKILNVSYFALLRKIKAGELPSYSFGRKILVDLEEVKLAMRRNPTTS